MAEWTARTFRSWFSPCRRLASAYITKTTRVEALGFFVNLEAAFLFAHLNADLRGGDNSGFAGLWFRQAAQVVDALDHGGQGDTLLLQD